MPSMVRTSPGWMIRDRVQAVFEERATDSLLSMRAVAEAAGVTVRDVEATLAALGESFDEHVRRLRLQQAYRDLTSDVDRPVFEIAAAAGYAAVEVFTVQFAQHFGLTPEDVRAFAR